MTDPVENTGWTLDGYHEAVYCDLVWSMAHDDWECPDLLYASPCDRPRDVLRQDQDIHIP